MTANVSASFREYFTRGEYQVIVKKHESKASLSSLSYDDLFLLAGSYYKLSRYQETIDVALASGIGYSHSVDLACLVGSSFRKLGELDKAIAVYDSCLLNFPEEAKLLNNKANALIDCQRYESAQSLISLALKIKPDYPDALSNQSLISSLRANQLSSVNTNSLQTTSQLSSFHALDPLLQAFARQPTVRNEHKRVESDNSSDCDPQSIENTSVLGQFEAIVSELNSESSAERIIEVLSLSRSLIDTDLSRATILVNSAISNNPLYPPCYQVRGECRLAAGELGSALIDFLQALLLGQKNVALYLNLASIFHQQGDAELSSFSLSLAKQLDSQSPLLEQFQLQMNRAE